MIAIDLSGKIALVSGASQGIGQACAKVLAQAGASVALAARNEENLRKTASAIAAAGGRAEAMAGDLTAAGRTEEVVEETRARLGGVDFLIHAAGVSRRSDPTGTTDEDIDLAIDLKLRAAVRLTKAVIPRMRERGGGSIVYFSGLSHVHTSEYHGSGCISNAGLAAYKHQLARRLAPENIRVNLINPGTTDTPRYVRQTARIAELTNRAHEEVDAERRGELPMGRLTRPEDCANAALFLVSDLASNVTGESINVDGGRCDAVRP